MATEIDELGVVIKTVKGDICADIFFVEAPITAANFINLAKRGFYDGVTFHRVITNFMIQGGDPTGSGRGGPGYTFADEFSPDRRHNAAGVMSMANAGPGTNGSQFFITHGPTPHLDDAHTVFGKVSSGQDVVNAIAQGDVITSITVSGDATALFEAQKENIDTWNAVLDRQ